MIDIILDTNCLDDFLAQYFDRGTANRGAGYFVADGYITTQLARHLNRVVKSSVFGVKNLIITSAHSFVEISRKWDRIVKNRYSIEQMHSFITQPPEWFDIAPVDEDLLQFFVQVPKGVYINRKWEATELMDAIHYAVVISRGNNASLATSDEKLQAITAMHGRILLWPPPVAPS